MTGLSCLLGTLLWASEPSRFADLSEGEIGRELAAIHAARPKLVDRIDAVSERFLGVPYRTGPLGEGEAGEFDRDPLISFREADCTTFVEQVMALALESDLAKAKELLQRIRYRDGKIAYETRNHFPETDWIPNNAAAGFLRDITRSVAGQRTRWVFKTIDKRAWYLQKSSSDLEGLPVAADEERAQRVDRWRSLGKALRSENARLAYLPLEHLPLLLPLVPSGTVGNVVRESLPDKPVVVTHQILILQKHSGPIVRHAAFGRSVEDAPAAEYFARFKDAKWRVLGLNLSAIRSVAR